jgi:hypothetical protein
MSAVFEQYHLEVERLDDDGDVFKLSQIDHSGEEDMGSPKYRQSTGGLGG